MSKVFAPAIRAQIIHRPDEDSAVVLVMVGATPIGTYVAVCITGHADATVAEAIIGGLLLGDLELDELEEPEEEEEPEAGDGEGDDGTGDDGDGDPDGEGDGAGDDTPLTDEEIAALAAQEDQADGDTPTE